MTSAPSDPMKLAMVTGDSPKAVNCASNVMAAMAPSEAPADTPSVSGDASGCAAAPERPRRRAPGAADQCRGQHARQTGDEEDLRVCVVRPRNRAIEDPREVDRRASNQWRQ